ncbi:hypothetical protein RFN29_06675 [Mesorhizobium sp. VK22B]|uniref:Uncharacterized protein n=1 Tax=Mesorhizobium captivum TaxID=3072319 RepID=A0ABU4YWC3_9HYPH|nr:MULTISPECIES: hypothetical protein [unclassified Mesorhizobium]MDX8491260.1 hypothetical protein [Mesorhizobium sp. VK22B]MDX8507904.1 hypothetical protein [Mesorhizobium sp. VK22E]
MTIVAAPEIEESSHCERSLIASRAALGKAIDKAGGRGCRIVAGFGGSRQAGDGQRTRPKQFAKAFSDSSPLTLLFRRVIEQDYTGSLNRY